MLIKPFYSLLLSILFFKKPLLKIQNLILGIIKTQDSMKTFSLVT